MKFLILLCACVALVSASTLKEEAGSHPEQKRFLASVAHFFTHAYETVKGGVVTAAHAVAGAAETAAGAIKGAAQTAIGDITDAAHKVEGGVVHAVHDVGQFASEAKHLLSPVLDKIASTAGPIAKEILDAAVQQLKEQAPHILQALGEMGLHELATTVLTSAVGKREIHNDIDALKELFAHVVQTKVNETVDDVHKVVKAVDKFNAGLKQEIENFEHILQAGHNTEEAAKNFYLNVVAKIQPLVDAKAFEMDVNRFDKIVPDAVTHFHQLLKQALVRSVEKRGALLDLAQNVLGLVQAGEDQIGHLVGHVQNLASSLLAPTVNNVKSIAQMLLDNASNLTSGLMSKAMALLAPFQQQLGPLFQKVQALAGTFGLVG